MIHVEVVYALPHEQKVFELAVTPDMTVEEIIKESGVLETYPQIDLTENKVGIFSRLMVSCLNLVWWLLSRFLVSHGCLILTSSMQCRSLNPASLKW